MAPPRRKKEWSLFQRFLLLAFLVFAALCLKYMLGAGLAHMGITGPFSSAGGDQAAGGGSAAEVIPTTPRELVEYSIRKNRVIIFSKSYCPYSMQGKAVMRKHLGDEVPFVIELDKREDGGEIQDELQRITGGRTVPRIFVDKKFIGGADDVAAMDSKGELEALLKKQGLI